MWSINCNGIPKPEFQIRHAYTKNYTHFYEYNLCPLSSYIFYKCWKITLLCISYIACTCMWKFVIECMQAFNNIESKYGWTRNSVLTPSTICLSFNYNYLYDDKFNQNSTHYVYNNIEIKFLLVVYLLFTNCEKWLKG